MKKANANSRLQVCCLEKLEDRLFLSATPISPMLVEGRPGVDILVGPLPEVEMPQEDPIIEYGLLQFRDSIAAAKAADPEADVSGLGDFFQRVTPEGQIQIYVFLQEVTPEAQAALEADGLTIELAVDVMKVVQGWASYDAIDTIAAESGVTLVGLPGYGMTNAGDVMTSGDGIQNSDDLRTQLSLDGTDIKVGVISDGITNWTLSRASGDLPTTIHYDNSGNGNEGTAMLEIVHDIAPGADLYFAPAASNAALVTAINWMRTQGVDVIVDDLTFYIASTVGGTEPYFTDGPSSSVANTAKSAVNDGITYVTSAGNWQTNWDWIGGGLRSHWQGQYVNSTGGWNDFDPGASGNGPGKRDLCGKWRHDLRRPAMERSLAGKFEQLRFLPVQR